MKTTIQTHNPVTGAILYVVDRINWKIGEKPIAFLVGKTPTWLKLSIQLGDGRTPTVAMTIADLRKATDADLDTLIKPLMDAIK